MPEGHISGPNRHGYTIRRVDRFDAGRYTCTADNKVGRPAKAHIDLQVLCKYPFRNSFFCNVWGTLNNKEAYVKTRAERGLSYHLRTSKK